MYVAVDVLLKTYGIQWYITVRHVTGNDEDYLRKIPRVVVQKSALYKGPL